MSGLGMLTFAALPEGATAVTANTRNSVLGWATLARNVTLTNSASPVEPLNHATMCLLDIVSYGNDSFNGSIRFTTAWLNALKGWCSEEGCSFQTGTIPDAYAFSNYAFCKASLTCASGSEPLVAGQMARVGFGISPNPTSQVRAEAYWNGTKYNEFTWAAPPPPGGGTFYVSDPALGFPAGPGSIELRIWVGAAYVGSIKAAVAAAPPAPTLTPTSRPTATATATPTQAAPGRPFRGVIMQVARD